MEKNNLEHINFDTLEAFEKKAAQTIIDLANQCINLNNHFSIVLCGGNTPRSIFNRLKSLETDWSKWNVYFGDERCLPEGDPGRNSEMAKESWLNHVSIPQEQIFYIRGELGRELAADEYDQLLDEKSFFDLVLLGFGEDGHVASLFPGHQWDDYRNAIPVTNSPKPPTDRVSLTPKRLSMTNHLIFLVTGKNKIAAFNRWQNNKDLPASLVCAKESIKILSFDLV